MEKRSNIIYDATRQHLMNNLEQLQRLQQEGIRVGSLPEKVWGQLEELIEREDAEKLDKLREELKEYGTRKTHN